MTINKEIITLLMFMSTNMNRNRNRNLKFTVDTCYKYLTNCKILFS